MQKNKSAFRHSGERLIKLFMKRRYLVLPVLLFMGFYAESHPQDDKITLNVNNATMAYVLNQIESQSDFSFFYKTEEIDLNRKVSLHVNQMPIEKILKMIFNDGSVSFTTVKNQIVLKKNVSNVSRGSARIEEAPNQAVQVAVSGTVKDEGGNPIPNVSVMEAGTGNGVGTNNEGSYTITVSGNEAVLVFTSVGYTKQEIIVGNQRSLHVTLLDDVQALSEIIVLGYASQQKSDLTGAVSTVNAEDINNLPATSVAETLQGRVSGVQVVTGSGEPGATSDIVIRGGGSVNGMPPLFIVDGIRMGTNYSFNNQDIESIEILKDASAAAIYGAQAAGGVVLIQTKRGARAQEKINVNFDGYYGIRNAINVIPLLNTEQYFRARRAFGADVSAWGNPAELPDVNWTDVLFNPGADQNYSLSLNGASDKANYYVSGNYFRQKGVRLDNSFERYTLRLNSDYILGPKLRVGETVYLYRSYSNPPEAGGTYFRSVPSMAVRDADGAWGDSPAGGYFNGRNPAQRTLGAHGGTGEHAIEGNVYLDYKILDGLSFRATLGASIGSSQYSLFNEAYNTGAQTGPANLTKTFTAWENYTANFVLNYTKTFGLHDIKALAGYEVYREDRHYMEGYAVDFAVNETQSFFLNTALETQRVTGGLFPDSRLLSQFGRVNYSFNNKYLFSATIRRDGSDRFGAENKWGIFPAFSAGWRISEEPFFNVDAISSLQLRASYGLLGNIGAIPQYLYQGSFGPQNITGLADGSKVQSYGRNLSMPNPRIKWEEVKTTDVGVDISFLTNRLTVTADWYRRITQDMIYAVPVPLSAGYDGNPVFTNIGELSNQGVELGVNYQASIGDLTMNLGANGSYNENKVISLDGTSSQAINAGEGGQYLSNLISRTVPGQPLSQFYGYVVDGIFATDQEVADRGITQTGAGAGDLIYRDVNGDGIITEEDRDFIGNPWPKFNYGLNFSFNYKRFDLSMAFQGVFDMDIYNANRHYSDFLAGDYNTSPAVFDASFFDGNGLTDRPRLGFTNGAGDYVRDPNANYTKISSYFVENASYLKLRNIQLGYNFSGDFLEKLNMTSASIYVMAQNVFTLTNYTGTDPEVLGEGITARGIDNNSRYPQTRFVSLGVKLGF
ncbi:TonB-dependent receptor [Parapedobacter lycopersici]|uniref:TonB-dependent receptor n=1 Tax=Parapedobacter lycopersici TaxID=1864939 RepID=UPI00214DC6B7|nr:TonB-dependent receptor [Parapedobacter lycopersici]